MARPITYAIRVTFANGRDAFVREGGVIGQGRIATYRTRALADADADFIRQGLDDGAVATVIQRSHGRQAEPPTRDA